jgi:type IV pilus assembly protein PilC
MFTNQYLATVRDESQQLTKRIVYASSQSKAAAQLQKAKYRLISMEMRESPFWVALKKGKIEIGNPASKRELATFSNNLALMVQTKVNTANAFQILADSTPKERFRRVILEARKRVMDGESISQSFTNFPEVFDEVYVAIVQASETSGQLPVALRERSKALKRSDKVLRKLKNAMIYPVIVLLMALGAVMVFSIMAVPALSNLYKGTGVELPLVTRIIVMFSNFLRASPLSVVGVLAVPVLLFLKRKAIFENPRLQRFALKIPLLRDLISKGACLRILQLLHQFSTANVTMPKQLFLCQQASGHIMFSEALERIRYAIQTSGVTLSEAFKRERVFPRTISGNIQAGEATGSLPEVLAALNEYYVEDLDDAVTRFTAALEPVMIIFLAAIIGTMVIAMYLPLFNLVKILQKHK